MTTKSAPLNVLRSSQKVFVITGRNGRQGCTCSSPRTLPDLLVVGAELQVLQNQPKKKGGTCHTLSSCQEFTSFFFWASEGGCKRVR